MMPSEHRRETEFLRRCILYDDTAERQELEEKLVQAERNEHCVQRAVWLMALFTALAMAGLCYSVIFQVDYPQNMSYLSSPIMSKVFCALGLGSLISLMAFLGLGAVYRKEMDQRRDEWRQLATKVLESRRDNALPLPSKTERTS